MSFRIPLFTIGLVLVVLPLLPGDDAADAATITVEYAKGHRRVLINDYGTPALGTFVLRDIDHDLLALCVEAGDPHSSFPEAYAAVENGVDSAELDTLVWLLGDGGGLDDDTATAAAALAWYYAGARRDIGPLVWSNGAAGFSPIGPLDPEPWDQLARFSVAHPVGLRVPGGDLDHVEARLAELHRHVVRMRGAWALTGDSAQRAVQLAGPAGPIAGQLVSFTIDAPDQPQSTLTAITDIDGWARPQLPELPAGAAVAASVDAPGVHREWDGPGGIQRVVTATTATITAGFDVPGAPTTTTTSTSTTSTSPATTSTTSSTTSTTTTSTTTSTTSTTTTPSSTTTTTTTQPAIAPTTTTPPTTTTAPTTTTTTTSVGPTTTRPAPSTTVGTVVYPAVPVVPVVPEVVSPVVPVVPVVASQQTLPRTGSSAANGVLRWADGGFVLGVALIALTSLVPRRSSVAE